MKLCNQWVVECIVFVWLVQVYLQYGVVVLDVEQVEGCEEFVDGYFGGSWCCVYLFI